MRGMFWNLLSFFNDVLYREPRCPHEAFLHSTPQRYAILRFFISATIPVSRQCRFLYPLHSS